MTQTQPYRVERDFVLGARMHRRGQTVALTGRQARHLLLGGFLEPEPRPEKHAGKRPEPDGDTPAAEKKAPRGRTRGRK